MRLILAISILCISILCLSSCESTPMVTTTTTTSSSSGQFSASKTGGVSTTTTVTKTPVLSPKDAAFYELQNKVLDTKF